MPDGKHCATDAAKKYLINNDKSVNGHGYVLTAYCVMVCRKVSDNDRPGVGPSNKICRTDELVSFQSFSPKPERFTNSGDISGIKKNVRISWLYYPQHAVVSLTTFLIIGQRVVSNLDRHGKLLLLGQEILSLATSL
jgi:hypothetical protein